MADIYLLTQMELAETRAERDDWKARCEAAQADYRQVRSESEAWQDRCEAACDAVVKLQAFKDWVHSYLDTHGVPHHPPGTHGAAGCRIGDRMDWLMAQKEAAQEQIKQLRESLMWALSAKLDTVMDVEIQRPDYDKARAILKETAP